MSKLTTPGFAELCCFVAVRQTQREDDILSELVQNVLGAATPTVATAEDMTALLKQRFGLDLGEVRIGGLLDRLVSTQSLRRRPDGTLALSPTRERVVQARLELACAQEARVRDEWLTDVHGRHPEIDPVSAWAHLENFSRDAFRQHGLYTLSLVDPTLDVPDEYQLNLSSLLRGALTDVRQPAEHDALASEIERFFVDAGNIPDRARYVRELADSVVSYLALSMSDGTAVQLREALSPLTLFLDTNVLFGIVGLDDGPLVAASTELVTIGESNRLPLRLRYHQNTERELQNTLESASTRLKVRHWPTYISRGAALLPTISTIQRLYHERNAVKPITAGSFFAPFEHIDVLIQQKGVLIYREEDAVVDRQALYDLIAEYEVFLTKHGRKKEYEARAHDMTVLSTVRRLRSKAPSSLHAEALLVTYDVFLFKFDRQWCKRSGTAASVVLPTQLMQLLRAFLPTSEDFDLSFASAFAVPAFRAAGARSHAATARMVDLVSSYADLSPATAEAVLSNHLLLDGLKSAKDDGELRSMIDSAIAAENAALSEANARLKLEAEEHAAHAEKAEREAMVRVAEIELKAHSELNALVETRAALQIRNEVERQRSGKLDSELSRARAEIEADDTALTKLRARVASLETISESDRQAKRTWRAAFFGVTATVGLGLGSWKVARAVRWQWLLNHPNGLGLVVMFSLAIGLIVYGAIQPKHRTIAWISGAIGAAIGGLALLGKLPA